MNPYLQAIVNIAVICARKGVKKVVLSPGSRCAPLTIAFARHPEIETYTISDERSAAFIALGMAQQTGQAVALVCTSGTAVLNYGPAIAEAHYQNTPLLVFSADRPPEWIDQMDGQTIRQQQVHTNHTKADFQLPVSYEHPNAVWQIQRTLNEAINLAVAEPKGVVHLNIPFREPFYPKPNQVLNFDFPVQIIRETKGVNDLPTSEWERLFNIWQKAEKVLIIGGQHSLDKSLNQNLSKLSSLGITVISDVISNLHNVSDSIKNQDNFLGQISEEQKKELQPDLLVTFGRSVISKNLKIFLRKNPPKQHWHIQKNGYVADTFQCLSDIIRVTPKLFFTKALEKDLKKLVDEDANKDTAKEKIYFKLWNEIDKKVENSKESFFQNQSFSELEAVHLLLKQIPSDSVLHLANSMSVRYANFINLREDKNVEVFANRGTSGIDGSTSTAIGHAISDPERLHFLLTGDLAFFYDRNAFWNNYISTNLRVLLLNNHGGVIFRMIPDPQKQVEFEEYFVTEQRQNAQRTAEDFGLEYSVVNTRSAFSDGLKDFISKDGNAKILELETNSQLNQEVVGGWKEMVKKELK